MPQRARLVLASATIAAGFVVVPTSTGRSANAVRAPSRPEVAQADSLFGVFEGRTPCGRIATEFTGFPAQNCEKIKWRLTLYRNQATGSPSSYRYHGTRTTRQGYWRVATSGGAQRARTVYHLTPAGPGGALSLLSIDDKVLLLLEPDGEVLVGDASWSYALNRVDLPSR
jgi:hypothetical protein